MYGVFSWKKALFGVIFFLLALFFLLGTAGRTMQALASPRELPIYSVDTGGEKLAALGINCAWDDSGLDDLLAILDTHSVRATFFLVGEWAEKYPQAVKKIAGAGHELASHSDTHADMAKLSRQDILAELENSRQTIETISGQEIHLFRPPSGSYNDRLVSTAREAGWEVIQWSNDSIDWKEPPVQDMADRVCKKAAPGDIMLWHLGKKNTPAAIEAVLGTLCGQGYRFVAVGELIRPAPYTIDHTGRQFPADT